MSDRSIILLSLSFPLLLLHVSPPACIHYSNPYSNPNPNPYSNPNPNPNPNPYSNPNPNPSNTTILNPHLLLNIVCFVHFTNIDTEPYHVGAGGGGVGRLAGVLPKMIIFVSRKSDCDNLVDLLLNEGYSVDSLHGDKSQVK